MRCWWRPPGSGTQVAATELLGQRGYWKTFWDDEDAFYGHVLGRKGLERLAVMWLLLRLEQVLGGALGDVMALVGLGVAATPGRRRTPAHLCRGLGL